MWLYSQDELRDMRDGNFGEDKLPYKNDTVYAPFSNLFLHFVHYAYLRV